MSAPGLTPDEEWEEQDRLDEEDDEAERKREKEDDDDQDEAPFSDDFQRTYGTGISAMFV